MQLGSKCGRAFDSHSRWQKDGVKDQYRLYIFHHKSATLAEVKSIICKSDSLHEDVPKITTYDILQEPQRPWRLGWPILMAFVDLPRLPSWCTAMIFLTHGDVFKHLRRTRKTSRFAPGD